MRLQIFFSKNSNIRWFSDIDGFIAADNTVRNYAKIGRKPSEDINSGSCFSPQNVAFPFDCTHNYLL